MLWTTKPTEKEAQIGDKRFATRFALWPTNLTNRTTCWLLFYLVEQEFVRQNGDPVDPYAPDTYTEWVTIRKYLPT